jgi:hypothetical protein
VGLAEASVELATGVGGCSDGGLVGAAVSVELAVVEGLDGAADEIVELWSVLVGGTLRVGTIPGLSPGVASPGAPPP